MKKTLPPGWDCSSMLTGRMTWNCSIEAAPVLPSRSLQRSAGSSDGDLPCLEVSLEEVADGHPVGEEHGRRRVEGDAGGARPAQDDFVGVIEGVDVEIGAQVWNLTSM